MAVVLVFYSENGDISASLSKRERSAKSVPIKQKDHRGKGIAKKYPPRIETAMASQSMPSTNEEVALP